MSQCRAMRLRKPLLSIAALSRYAGFAPDYGAVTSRNRRGKFEFRWVARMFSGLGETGRPLDAAARLLHKPGA